MTAKEYYRFAARLRAYRCAFHRFIGNFENEKAAAILPRLKLAESQEIEMYNKFRQNL